MCLKMVLFRWQKQGLGLLKCCIMKKKFAHPELCNSRLLQQRSRNLNSGDALKNGLTSRLVLE